MYRQCNMNDAFKNKHFIYQTFTKGTIYNKWTNDVNNMTKLEHYKEIKVTIQRENYVNAYYLTFN